MATLECIPPQGLGSTAEELKLAEGNEVVLQGMLERKHVSHFSFLDSPASESKEAKACSVDNLCRCLNALKTYLNEEHKAKKGSPLDMDEWETTLMKVVST